jgi:hypothetical protein
MSTTVTETFVPRAARTGPPHNIRHFDSASLATILEIGPHLKSTESRLLFDVPPQKQTCLDVEKNSSLVPSGNVPQIT